MALGGIDRLLIAGEAARQRGRDAVGGVLPSLLGDNQHLGNRAVNTPWHRAATGSGVSSLIRRAH
jgi:hypothetical protein